MRNVIFDVGGVLLDWNPGTILQGYYTDATLRAQMQRAVFLHPDWLELDRGTLSEPEALERLHQRTGRPLDELAGLFAAVRSSLQPKPDSIALLHDLARRAVPLYCLSNMPASTFTYLRERHEFWSLFQGIVISGEVRMAKPEPAIFAHLLERHGLVAHASVFIDDLAPNVRAAQSLGLQAVLFQDARQCAAELQVLLA
jgi:HAD superfamily hydrolase (TIGR01509 family)